MVVNRCWHELQSVSRLLARRRAERRLGAVGRRVNHRRERMQVIRFCVAGAGRPMTFSVAAGRRCGTSGRGMAFFGGLFAKVIPGQRGGDRGPGARPHVSRFVALGRCRAKGTVTAESASSVKPYAMMGRLLPALRPKRAAQAWNR